MKLSISDIISSIKNLRKVLCLIFTAIILISLSPQQSYAQQRFTKEKHSKGLLSMFRRIGKNSKKGSKKRERRKKIKERDRTVNRRAQESTTPRVLSDKPERKVAYSPMVNKLRKNLKETHNLKNRRSRKVLREKAQKVEERSTPSYKSREIKYTPISPSRDTGTLSGTKTSSQSYLPASERRKDNQKKSVNQGLTKAGTTGKERRKKNDEKITGYGSNWTPQVSYEQKDMVGFRAATSGKTHSITPAPDRRKNNQQKSVNYGLSHNIKPASDRRKENDRKINKHGNNWTPQISIEQKDMIGFKAATFNPETVRKSAPDRRKANQRKTVDYGLSHNIKPASDRRKENDRKVNKHGKNWTPQVSYEQKDMVGFRAAVFNPKTVRKSAPDRRKANDKKLNKFQGESVLSAPEKRELMQSNMLKFDGYVQVEHPKHRRKRVAKLVASYKPNYIVVKQRFHIMKDSYNFKIGGKKDEYNPVAKKKFGIFFSKKRPNLTAGKTNFEKKYKRKYAYDKNEYKIWTGEELPGQASEESEEEVTSDEELLDDNFQETEEENTEPVDEETDKNE